MHFEDISTILITGGRTMENLFHRVSIRKYQDKPVRKEDITEILRAGMQAPSAGNQQPWEFYVVTDKDVIAQLAKVSPYAGCAAVAPAVIVPVYRTDGLRFPEFAQIDLAIAQENMWIMRCLACHCTCTGPHGCSQKCIGSAGYTCAVLFVSCWLAGGGEETAGPL